MRSVVGWGTGCLQHISLKMKQVKLERPGPGAAGTMKQRRDLQNRISELVRDLARCKRGTLEHHVISWALDPDKELLARMK